jgi:alanine racemase
MRNRSLFSDIPSHIGAVLTVDCDAIAANWGLLARRVAPTRCAAVVKCNGYGLGAAAVAPALYAAGCRDFFVAHPEEGYVLRELLPDARICVLHGASPGTEIDMARFRLVPVLNELSAIERWQASSANGPVPAIIHFDTGINRLGLTEGESDRLIQEPSRLDRIDVQAWMTHFACPDEPDHPRNRLQLQRFQAILGRLPPAPSTLASSSALFLGPEYWGDLARPGAALYGVNPTPGMPNPMRPVVTLQARILQVKSVAAGEAVGYGATAITSAPKRMAVLALGYGDGFLRSQSSRGSVHIAGVPCPLLGRISMDLTSVDVSAVPDSLLDQSSWAEVIGTVRTVDDVAESAGTIGYEVLTSLGERYQRRYLSSATAQAVDRDRRVMRR